MNKILMILTCLISLSGCAKDEVFEAYGRRDFPTALAQGKAYALKGNTRLAGVVGNIYRIGGNGVERDYAEAAKWYEMSAKGDNFDMMLHMARLYARGGYGLEPDINKALIWYNKAIAGRVLASTTTSYTSAAGTPIIIVSPPDIVVMDSQYEYARLLFENARSLGVLVAASNSLLWAAKNGEVRAMIEAEQSLASSPDLPEAEKAKAQAKLKELHDKGMQLIRWQVMSDFPSSQFKYAVYLARGEQFPKNEVDALKWLTLALDHKEWDWQRDEAEILRDQLMARLSSGQQAEALAGVERCRAQRENPLPLGQPGCVRKNRSFNDVTPLDYEN